MKKHYRIVSMMFCMAASSVLHAHHGIASLGTIGLEGAGAPVDSSTSATLPEASSLISFKLDRARYLNYSPTRDDESATADFFIGGYGYGWTPYLSTYVFLPYNVKRTENNSFNTAGFADLSLLAVIGFRHTDGEFHLVPSSESLDEMEEWHFTVYGGLTLPTGQSSTAHTDGSIDPGMATGFGSSSYTAGFTTTKMFRRLTFVQDLSYISFDPHTYADGIRLRFGAEARYNIAFVWQTLKSEAKKSRLDTVLEFSATRIYSDRQRGVSKPDRIRQIAAIQNVALPDSSTSAIDETTPPWTIATELASAQASFSVPEYDPWGTLAQATGVRIDPSGTDILYGLIGWRAYFNRLSISLGVKTPLASRMNSVPLANQLTLAYLRGVQSGKNADEAAASEYWTREVYKERQFQGSEGRENYRLIFTLSTMF